jgi:hypothetical protein
MWVLRPTAFSLPARPYGSMPCMDEQAIPILRVANAAAAVARYERLGFTQE